MGLISFVKSAGEKRRFAVPRMADDGNPLRIDFILGGLVEKIDDAMESPRPEHDRCGVIGRRAAGAHAFSPYAFSPCARL